MTDYELDVPHWSVDQISSRANSLGELKREEAE